MTKVFSFAKEEVKNIVQTTSATTALLLLIITLTVAATTTGGVISVWAANLIGTSVPDTLEGTDEAALSLDPWQKLVGARLL